MHDRSARAWIWASLALQCVGYIYDAVWHGWANPGAEPQTRDAMLQHLGSVHLPLYIGTLSVLVATFTVLVDQTRRRSAGVALPIAFAGALLSAGAEAWHAASHLRLDTHTAPIAGTLSLIGFLVVVTAISLWGHGQSGHSERTRERHRAA